MDKLFSLKLLMSLPMNHFHLAISSRQNGQSYEGLILVESTTNIRLIELIS